MLRLCQVGNETFCACTGGGQIKGFPEGSLKTGLKHGHRVGNIPTRDDIHRSGERFASSVTDYIAVNGKPAEMLFKNGWVPIGYLPRGVVITTKRKYLERLAASKKDEVHTNVVEHPGQDPQNLVDRYTTSTLPFSLIEDKNPLGAEWLSQLLRQQG